MVRLKLQIGARYYINEQQSQFHYGSIKTESLSVCVEYFDKYLNSTMVRLKRIYLACKCIYRFNLNSTMVRLKKKILKGKFKSQFHYGSIKTTVPLLSNEKDS